MCRALCVADDAWRAECGVLSGFELLGVLSVAHGAFQVTRLLPPPPLLSAPIDLSYLADF